MPRMAMILLLILGGCCKATVQVKATKDWTNPRFTDNLTTEASASITYER